MSRTIAKNIGVSVGLTSTVVLPANISRNTAYVTNDGANIVYLAFGTPAVVGAGVRLSVGSSPFRITEWQETITAIAVTGATNVTVSEF